MNASLRQEIRVRNKKNAEPSVAIIDSQSIKTTESGGERGFDGYKKINGRKRHLLVDTLGLILKVIVHPANIQNTDGAIDLIKGVKSLFPQITKLFADLGYENWLFDTWLKGFLSWDLELVTSLSLPMDQWIECIDPVERNHGVVKRSDSTPGSKDFKVQPKRWVVERTFAWLGRFRRLSKDYERLTHSSETIIYAAMTRLMLNRLAS